MILCIYIFIGFIVLGEAFKEDDDDEYECLGGE